MYTLCVAKMKLFIRDVQRILVGDWMFIIRVKGHIIQEREPLLGMSIKRKE
ncbi:hypothetical protein EDD57_1388 [Baia soyae]|uniref:Uncharacterized protein n=1 Tax=Baia soyae TaxID=1544746 RepID=A0A4R2RZV3_9BACL|nr:hypothetical protein EDD57_1388 [Baia soyae]